MRFFNMFIGIFIVIILTGCIGEKYDFSPPTVTLVNPDYIMQKVILTEANIDWRHDEKYNKKTENIQTLAEELDPLFLNAGQKVDYTLEDGQPNSSPDEISVSVWKNDKELILEPEEIQSFRLPNEKGEYIIVFDLSTTKGNAQYVGNLVIK